MSSLIPAIDHIVLDVRDGMDEAAASYRALGFQLTERGYHTLGSMNHLAIFDTDYVELLGFPNHDGSRPDVAAFPAGLNGLVFKTDDAAATHAALQDAGCAPTPVQAFSRPVRLAEGVRDAKFRTTHLPASSVSYGRLYFCEHLTPDLVWRPDWQRHPNGVTAIARILIAAHDPAAASASLAKIFGASCLRTQPDGSVVLRAGEAEIAFVPPAALAGAYSDALPDAGGRTDFMAVMVLRTRSCAAASQALAAGGITSARHERGQIVVPARSALNVTLVFAE